jgi:hypothetical protein
MKSRILVRAAFVSLITFGLVGTTLAGEPNKPDCPPPFQRFEIDAFTEAEAAVLWPTGADAYATQEEAAVDYPDLSLEAFFWSNIVVKEGTLEALQSVDFDADGLLCMKYLRQEHGHYSKLFPDYDPLYLFIFGDKGR